MTYIFKRPFRKAKLVYADDTLSLRRKCEDMLGRKAGRYRYRQIGSRSFRIEGTFGLTVADIYTHGSY